MTEELRALESRLVAEIQKTLTAVQPKLDAQAEEIRKNGAASDATGRSTAEAHKKLDALQAELAEVRESRDEAIKRQGEAQERLDAIEKKLIRQGKMSEGDKRPRALQGRKDILARMASLGLALASGDNAEALRTQIEAFQGSGGQNRYRRKITRDQMRAAWSRQKRADDVTMGFGELDSMRDDVVLPAVLDPLRPPTLRDIMTVLPLTGDRTRYSRETAYFPIATKVLTGVTLPAATPTAIEVYSAAGFKVGSTVYGDAAKTKSGVVTAVDPDASPQTVTVDSAAGFTVAADDELWSLERTPVSQGQNKPQMKMDSDSITLATKIFPARATIHRQELRDIPAIQQRLVGRMQQQLRIDEEDQVLNGSGTGEELTGIRNTAGINTHLQSLFPTDTKLDAIRRSRTYIDLFYHMPSAVTVHPNDWEDIELLKADDNKYIFMQIPIQGTSVTVVWRLAVIPTTAMEEGFALTGDYRNGGAIAEREAFDFAMTDSNKDHFEKNLVDMRVEMESGVEVWYPKAFTEVTFT